MIPRVGSPQRQQLNMLLISKRDQGGKKKKRHRKMRHEDLFLFKLFRLPWVLLILQSVSKQTRAVLLDGARRGKGMRGEERNYLN